MRPGLPVLNVIPPPASHLAVAASGDPSQPRSPLVHRFDPPGHGPHLLLVDGTRVFELSADWASAFDEALRGEPPHAVADVLSRAGLGDSPPTPSTGPPPVRALALAVAQACNLACTYCYAQKGEFGGAPTMMSRETARAAVDTLVGSARRGETVHLGFLGGESLLNRSLLRETTEYAARLAAERGVAVGFSITTNATLVNADDIAFFEAHQFAVTVSLDGVGEAHDRLRVTRSGAGTYDRILERIGPWLSSTRRSQVMARASVTPSNLDLSETLDRFISLGFDRVAFSPVLDSPTGMDTMDAASLPRFLEAMTACGRRFEQEVAAGRNYPFQNMMTALDDIHRGATRTLPCKAGTEYLGVSADGDLFACHRFVGDESARFGDLAHGVDPAIRQTWFADRQVVRQEPCRSCWARYLCGGGCHHEVLRRGRVSCDYIRGWYHYVLEAYVRLLDQCPGYFQRQG